LEYQYKFAYTLMSDTAGYIHASYANFSLPLQKNATVITLELQLIYK